MQYYKIRDFGEKLSVTVDFFRENLKSLIVIGLVIGIPGGIASSIALSNYFGAFTTMMGETEEDSIAAVTNMMSSMGLWSIFSLIVYALLTGLIYTYMKKIDGGNEKPSIGDLFREVVPRVPGLVVLLVILFIIAMLGFTFFFIPGLYLMIVFSLAIPVYFFENASIGEAMSKPFKLIKGKWWSTFGLLFISGIIAGLASYVFAIPMYVSMFSGLFEAVESAETDPNVFLESYTSWQTVAGTAFFTMGSYILYSIPIIALAFQYFNLKERTEATGIRSEIDNFEALS